MSKSRLEWKVGLFVIIGLVLVAALLIQFSKGTTLFKPTYQLRLRAGSVSGLKTRATVSMAGVQVGTVSDIKLGPSGTNVTIFLRIYSEYEIRTNAEFSIENSGFLGDQFVAITPRPAGPDVPKFTDGDQAVATAPWTLIGVANRVLTSLANFDEAAESIKKAVEDIHHGALGPLTLSNFSITVANLKSASDRAVTLISNIDELILTNGPAIYTSGTNLARATAHFDDAIADARNLIATNRDGIARSISNLEASTEMLNSVLARVDQGEGLAGKLLRDPQMAAKASNIVSDLSITSSNLNQLGLWRVLFPKHPKAKETAKESSREAVQSPKERYH